MFIGFKKQAKKQKKIHSLEIRLRLKTENGVQEDRERRKHGFMGR